MKITGNDLSIFIGDNNVTKKSQESDEKNKKKGVINAKDLKIKQDPITKKREEARKQAMKVVADAFDGDKKIDDDIEERKNHINSLKKEMADSNEKIESLNKQKNDLKESFGIQDDSQEQKDLEILEKSHNGTDNFSDEEMQRLSEINKNGMTDYQKAALSIDSHKEPYEKAAAEAQNTLSQETAAIKSIRLGRLKSSPMLDAKNSADKIMESASKEVLGKMMSEVKETIDDKFDETKKKAEEKEEKQEKSEELAETVKEKRAKTEAAIEGDNISTVVSDSNVTENILDLDKANTDVQKDIKNIMDKMQLTDEDLKGAAVDEII